MPLKKIKSLIVIFHFVPRFTIYWSERCYQLQN